MPTTKQRNIYPQFLTDTEISVLLFDLLSRVYQYPLEYIIEALAPTTERDFHMLPEEKRKIYKAIQLSHMTILVQDLMVLKYTSTEMHKIKLDKYLEVENS
ncbi:MAG: hypothetical protein ACUVWK_04245 [Nitrososphaerales archaeon]